MVKIVKENYLFDDEIEALDTLKKRGNPLNRSKLSKFEMDEYLST